MRCRHSRGRHRWEVRYRPELAIASRRSLPSATWPTAPTDRCRPRAPFRFQGDRALCSPNDPIVTRVRGDDGADTPRATSPYTPPRQRLCSVCASSAGSGPDGAPGMAPRVPGMARRRRVWLGRARVTTRRCRVTTRRCRYGSPIPGIGRPRGTTRRTRVSLADTGLSAAPGLRPAERGVWPADAGGTRRPGVDPQNPGYDPSIDGPSPELGLVSAVH